MQMYVVCEKEDATKEDGEGEHRTHSNGLVGRKHTHIHTHIYIYMYHTSHNNNNHPMTRTPQSLDDKQTNTTTTTSNRKAPTHVGFDGDFAKVRVGIVRTRILRGVVEEMPVTQFHPETPPGGSAVITLPHGEIATRGHHAKVGGSTVLAVQVVVLVQACNLALYQRVQVCATLSQQRPHLAQLPGLFRAAVQFALPQSIQHARLRWIEELGERVLGLQEYACNPHPAREITLAEAQMHSTHVEGGRPATPVRVRLIVRCRDVQRLNGHLSAQRRENTEKR
jgi:hypothetical protein